MESKGCFDRFVWRGPFRHGLPVSGDNNVLLFLIQEGHLSHGKVYIMLLDRKGGIRESFLHLLFFQVPLTQNNPYTKAAYFGVSSSEPLPLLQKKNNCLLNCKRMIIFS